MVTDTDELLKALCAARGRGASACGSPPKAVRPEDVARPAPLRLVLIWCQDCHTVMLSMSS